MTTTSTQATAHYTRQMQILILGDSWGTPKGYATHIEPQRHTQYLLEEQGHTVTNCSIPGGSNLDSIGRALDKGVRPDLVIWFHTESLRDLHPRPSKKFSIPTVTQKQARVIYRQYARMLMRMGSPLDIIIGAQAPVIKELLVSQPSLLIPDWRCELLAIESIPTHSVCHSDLFEHPQCKDSAKDRLEWLTQNEKIVDMELESPLFPDNAHPGTRAHELLCTNHIFPLIEKYVDNA